MKHCRSLFIFLLLGLATVEALFPNTPKEFWVRAKRQQCRCVRNQNGNGLTCSCAQTPTDPNVAAAHLNSILADDVASQQQDLANQIAQQQSQQLAQSGQSGVARCACLQIVFHGNPQYQCQCADNAGTTIPTTVVPTLPPITSTSTQAPITVIPTTATQAPIITTAPTAGTTQSPIVTTAPPTVITTQTLPPSTQTLPPITSTTPAYYPITQTQANHCQCIMIRISSPSSAQYQCACPTQELTSTSAPVVTTTLPPVTLPPVTLPPVTLSPVTQKQPPAVVTTQTQPPVIITQSPVTVTLPPVTLPPVTLRPVTSTELVITTQQPIPTTTYPAVGTINTTSEGCVCIEPTTQTIVPSCGCNCNCATLTVSVPYGVCCCPQQLSQGTQPQPILVDEGVTNATPTLAPVAPTPASILADGSVAQTIQTTTDSTSAASVPQQTPLEQTAVQTQPQQQQQQQYPLTTTCVMYVGVPAGPCTCLPQYDPCAPNICCLKARYRSIKPHQNRIAFEPPTTEPSMVDMMMHVLKKIKSNLNHHRRR